MPPANPAEVMQVTFNTRLPRFTRAEFQRYWRDVHGPVTVQHARHSGFHHYEQWHYVDAGAEPGAAVRGTRGARDVPHPAHDVVSLLWYRDTAAMEAAARDRSPVRRDINRAIMRDIGFVDVRRSPSVVLQAQYEAGALRGVHPRDLPDAVKQHVVVTPLARPQGMSRDLFQARWRDVRGPLAEARLAAIGCEKYVQLRTVRGSGWIWGKALPEPDGIEVMWVAGAAAAAGAARAARRELLADMFVDTADRQQLVTPVFSSARPDAWRIRPYDGPMSPVAKQFGWFCPPPKL